MNKGFSKFMWFLTFFALVGGLLASWLAPKGISWYFNPPVDVGFNCRAPIEWALERLRWAQLMGILGGAVVGIIAFFIFSRKKTTNYQNPPFVPPT